MPRLLNCYIKEDWLVAHNPHHLDEMPKNRPSKYITAYCDALKVSWLQGSGSYGGHKVRKQGHRMVSGIVRQKMKKDVRREIENR